MSRFLLFRGSWVEIKAVFILCVAGTMLLLNGCGKSGTRTRPWMLYPGYKTIPVFGEDFDGDLREWFVEGEGEVVITEENRLLVAQGVEREGVVLWTKRDFSESFQLEYEVEIPDTQGMCIVVLCAQGVDGEDILTELPPRVGEFDEYVRGRIRGYSIAYHRYNADGSSIPGSRLRKNPGRLLLSHVDPDPCRENRHYFIDVVKIGGRIQFFVDGTLIHDVRDKGGFGPVYDDGKIGFQIWGMAGVFKIFLDNVRVFRLIPE